MEQTLKINDTGIKCYREKTINFVTVVQIDYVNTKLKAFNRTIRIFANHNKAKQHFEETMLRAMDTIGNTYSHHKEDSTFGSHYFDMWNDTDNYHNDHYYISVFDQEVE